MIAFIRGVLHRVGDGWVIVDTGSVGVRVTVPASTLARLPGEGSSVTLWTELHLRQDGIAVFGFSTEEERQLFDLLTSVSGVGPKGALAILSGASVETISTMIRQGDTKGLQHLPGVGRKTAERLVVELKDKLDHLRWGKAGQGVEDQGLVEGLLALGYTREEATRALELALSSLPPGAYSDPQQVLTAALRALGRP
ncbi:MAG: Holliday junction branch migration protein RuvA [Bacillota bacterium]